MKVTNVHIDQSVFTNIENKKLTTYIDRESGVVNDRYELLKNDIPYIVYYSVPKTLIIQLSIPKFLFGENVSLVKSEDIKTFWKKFELSLKGLLGVEVERREWIIQRIDVSWNFNVNNKVSDHIKELGEKKYPYKDTHCINQSETVMYKNKSSAIMFYNKQKECIAKKQSKSIIEKAKNILRMEIRPSIKDIQKTSLNRKAIEVLTVDFFKITTKKVLSNISINKGGSYQKTISHEWLCNQKISRVETVVGFNTIVNSIGEAKAKEVYGSTFYTRKKWSDEIIIPSVTLLPDLKIDYLNIE